MKFTGHERDLANPAGAWDDSLYMTGQNGLSALNAFGKISFGANLSVSSSGAVEVNSKTSTTKGFPSIEGFAYKMVQGELVVEVLFFVKEQDPSKLKGPMVDVPLVPHK